MKIRFFLFLAVSALFLFSCSTINVSHVDNDGAVEKSEGIYYSLPKTVVKVSVTVEKTTKLEGPFASYASKYLGLSEVISEKSTSYSLSSVTMDTYSVPDPDQYYFIETGKLKKKHLILNFGEYNLLGSVNGRFVKGGNKFLSDSVNYLADDKDEISTQNFINSNIAEAFDTIFEKIILDSSVIVKKTLKKVYKDKTNEQKAREAADLIMNIEESRLALYTGYSEVNYSKETIEYMAEKLLQMEQEYLNLFTGITVKQQLKYFYTYVPDGSYNVSLPLFRFSEKYGISDTSDYKGESVFVNLTSSGNSNVIASFEASRMETKEKSHGIYYRIPERARISLVYKDNEISASTFTIAQIGAICELQTKGLKSLQFNAETGSLQKVVYGKRNLFHKKH